MLLQKTQMCFNETDYVKVYSAINIKRANHAKKMQKMSQ